MFPEVLTSSLLFGLGLTVLIYCFAELLIARLNLRILPPIALACPVILLILFYVPGASYESYEKGAQFINFMLGPATIALAVPLHRNWRIVERYALPLAGGVIFSTVVSIVAIYFLGSWLGLSEKMLLSTLPKSVTTPIAIEISKPLGGLPAITTAAVILSGIMGATFNHTIFNLIGMKNDVAMGVAIGASSHGVGTSACAGVSAIQLALGGVSMGLCGIAASILTPLLLPVLRAL